MGYLSRICPPLLIGGGGALAAILLFGALASLDNPFLLMIFAAGALVVFAACSAVALALPLIESIASSLVGLRADQRASTQATIRLQRDIERLADSYSQDSAEDL